jgi:hypothetical protein
MQPPSDLDELEDLFRRHYGGLKRRARRRLKEREAAIDASPAPVLRHGAALLLNPLDGLTHTPAAARLGGSPGIAFKLLIQALRQGARRLGLAR